MPAPVQPAASRRETLYKESLAALILLSPVFFFAFLFGDGTLQFVAAAYFSVMTAVIIKRSRVLAEVRLDIERHDFRLCPVCRSTLVGLPDEGSCPACQYEFEHEALVTMWCDAYQISLDRHQRQVRAEDLLKCAGCGYSLEGLPEEGVCPECGEEYSPEVFRLARELGPAG